MSKPLPFRGDIIGRRSASNYAFSELVSASSSLHMPADKIPEERRLDPDDNFLTNTDYNVRHAMLHLHAGMQAVKYEGILLDHIRTELDITRSLDRKTFRKLEREAYDELARELKAADERHRPRGEAMISYEIKHYGNQLWRFIARHPSGATGSVTVDLTREGRVAVSKDRHLPIRLVEADPELDIWSTGSPYDCSITGESSYCDGTSLGRTLYTNDDDMLKLAESWIPWIEKE